jgi:signal transduction histidine kinase
MNHDVERSSNVLTDETPAANVSVWQAAGRSQRNVRRHEDERNQWRQLRAGEWHRGANSLGKRSTNRLLSILHSVIDEGRIVLQGLWPSTTPSTRLEQDLSKLLGEFAPAAGLRLRIVVTGQSKKLRSVIQEQIYLIGREALVNALRHSEATSIEAEVAYLPHRMRILIRDNGCGMEQKRLTARNSDRGLRAMLEGARAMGAQLQIWSKPGSGTEVELSLPLDSRAIAALNL